MQPDHGVGPIRVVIVEDDSDVRYLLAGALVDDGRFEVVGETSAAKSALEIVNATSPDVVLVDLHLGGRNGTWLLDRLRRAHRDLPLIAVTASTEARDHDAARTAGAARVLAKQDLSSTLVDEIHALVERGS